MQCRYLAAVCNPNSLPFPGYRSFVYCSLILGWRMDVLLPSDRAKRRETCVLSGTSSAFVAHLSRQSGCQFLLSVSKLQSLALEWNSGFAEALLVAWLGFFFWDLCARFVRKNEDFASVYLFPQTQYHGWAALVSWCERLPVHFYTWAERWRGWGLRAEQYRELQCSGQSSWDLQGVNLLEPEGSPCPSFPKWPDWWMKPRKMCFLAGLRDR